MLTRFVRLFGFWLGNPTAELRPPRPRRAIELIARQYLIKVRHYGKEVPAGCGNEGPLMASLVKETITPIDYKQTRVARLKGVVRSCDHKILTFFTIVYSQRNLFNKTMDMVLLKRLR